MGIALLSGTYFYLKTGEEEIVKKTLVIYDRSGDPAEAFAFDDICVGAAKEAKRIIRDAKKAGHYASHSYFVGTIGIRARPTRERVMADQTVHTLTKEVLIASEGKDVVDRYFDVKLALDVLRSEMDKALGKD